MTSLRHSASTRRLRVHRGHSLDLPADVVSDADGLPRTSVARTLIDLADVLTRSDLERLFLSLATASDCLDRGAT